MALTFPSDLSERYYFDLKFKTYSRPSPYTGKVNLGTPAIGPGGGLSNLLGSAIGTPVPSGGSIRLPIPANISDTQRLSWQQAENIGGLTEVATDLVTGQGDAAIGGATSQLGNFISEFSKGFQGFVKSGALVNTGDAAAYFMQKAGLALNPVLTQMFKHPEFKEHSFTWRLAPETQYESQTLQNIINTIKQQSLPDIVAGGAFFTYPSIAMIQIFSGANGSLYNFQPAVITAVTANYAPMGVPSFFAGTNAPTMVELTINLLEIILNTRSNMNHENVSGFDFSLGGIGTDVLTQKALSKVTSIL